MIVVVARCCLSIAIIALRSLEACLEKASGLQATIAFKDDHYIMGG